MLTPGIMGNVTMVAYIMKYPS